MFKTCFGFLFYLNEATAVERNLTYLFHIGIGEYIYILDWEFAAVNTQVR